MSNLLSRRDPLCRTGRTSLSTRVARKWTSVLRPMWGGRMESGAGPRGQVTANCHLWRRPGAMAPRQLCPRWLCGHVPPAQSGFLQRGGVIGPSAKSRDFSVASVPVTILKYAPALSLPGRHARCCDGAVTRRVLGERAPGDRDLEVFDAWGDERAAANVVKRSGVEDRAAPSPSRGPGRTGQLKGRHPGSDILAPDGGDESALPGLPSGVGRLRGSR